MKEFEENKIIIFLIWGIAAIIATLCTLDYDRLGIDFIIAGIIISIIIEIFTYSSSTSYLSTLIKIILVIGAPPLIFFLFLSFSLFSIFIIFITVLCYVILDFCEKDEIRLASLK